MTRSRLRNPTSKSTTTTLCPVCASAAPSAAVDVVFPTPPLPDVTTITFAICPSSSVSIQCRDDQCVAIEPGLSAPAAETLIDFFGGTVVTVNRQKLGFDAATKDARLPVSARAGQRAAAQRAVNMDRAAGHYFGPGGDRSDHRDVAVGKKDRLARTHRAVEHERGGFLTLRRSGLRFGALAFGGLDVRHRAATLEHWRQAGCELRVGALQSHDAHVARRQFRDQMRDAAAA